MIFCRKKRILVAEDDPDSRAVLRGQLRRLGLKADFTAGALEALRLAGETQPDLILLDVTLPGLDGFSVCRRIRKAEKEAGGTHLVPIIFMTNRPGEQGHTRLHSAQGFISKPLRFAEVKAAIETVL